VELLVLDARREDLARGDRREQQREGAGRGERHARQGERGRGGTGDGEEGRADATAEGAGHDVEPGQPGVRRHELVRLVDQLRHERLLDDTERLGPDEQGEGEEVEGQVQQREREGGRTRGAQGEQDRRDPSVAEAEVVDRRPDERGEQRERRHVDDEVEQDLLA
jgi:hypothetical protein